MSCKQFRTAISDAAVGGQPLQSAGLLQGRPPQKAAATTDDSVQQHLDACESCRAFYAAEQELFAAMDAGLSRVANSEPSVTFLPRVRAAIAQEVSVVEAKSATAWFAWWPVAGLAAAACLVLAVVVSTRFPSRPANNPVAVMVTAAVEVPSGGTDTQPAMGGVHASRVHRRVLKEAPKQPDGLPMAEVIVPPDEREALALFVSGLPQQQDSAIALARPAAAAAGSDLGAEALEIAELKLPPLLKLAPLEPSEPE